MRKKGGSSKQFRWSPPMQRVFYEILSDEARNPNNPTSNFKSSSLNKVAVAISERFNVQYEAKHVENRLKTVKNTWQLICKLKDTSGLGWDENSKIISCDQTTYHQLVMATPKFESYLNKPIEYYDEMALVVGKDLATGSFAKSFVDVELEDTNEVESMHVDSSHLVKELRGKACSSRVAPTSSQSSGRKRKSVELDAAAIKEVADQLGEVAKSLRTFTKDKYIFSGRLFKQLTSMAGFEEAILLQAYDYLMKNEVEARAFMSRKENQRKLWLEEFFATH